MTTIGQNMTSPHALESAYISRKLQSLAEQGFLSTAEAINAVRDQFIKGNSYGGSRSKIYVEKALREGYIETVRRMARLLIDIGANRNQETLQGLRDQASSLAQRFIKSYANSLFGSPAHDRNAETERAQGEVRLTNLLADDTQLVIDDAWRQIVGHTRHDPDPAERQAMSINVTNSPGANVQQGRDHLTQTIQQWDPRPLISVIETITARLNAGEIAVADADTLQTQLVTLQALATADRKDHGLIRRLGGFVGGLLKAGAQTATTTAVTHYAEQLLGSLPPIVSG